MALTKITGQVVDTTTDLVVGVTTVGGGVSAVDGFFSGIVTFSNSVSVAGTLTYEDVTNIDAVGIITARSNILVGSGITLSPDGDIFFTGIMTGNGSGLTGVANTDVIFTDKLSIGDGAQTSGDQINIGIGSDLRLYHNGSHNYLDSVNGNIYLRVNSTENAIKCTENGNVEISHDGSKKLETDGSGVTVTGRVAATSYTGDGSSLTGISVGIATTAASMTGITTVLDLSKDDFKVTASGITTVDVRGGTEGNNHQIRIVNSGITTVGFSTYFLFPSGGTPNLPTTDGAISFISFTVHRQGAVGLATQLLAGGSVNFS